MLLSARDFWICSGFQNLQIVKVAQIRSITFETKIYSWPTLPSHEYVDVGSSPIRRTIVCCPSNLVWRGGPNAPAKPYMHRSLTKSHESWLFHNLHSCLRSATSLVNNDTAYSGNRSRHSIALRLNACRWLSRSEDLHAMELCPSPLICWYWMLSDTRLLWLSRQFNT